MRVPLAATLMVAVLFAGCASSPNPDAPPARALDGLSAPMFDALPVEEVFVATSDGTHMHNAVFRPDTDQPVPVFINFSPYWGNTAELGGDGFGKYLIEHLVPRGYAVVLSAIRGTGHSEGCFEVASDREVQDLYEVIDFFAKESWSSGAIASGGKSYDSTTQNGLIAKMPHPALKGIFHVSGITDMYRYNYVNGVPYANGLTFTPRYAVDYSLDGSHPGGDAQQHIDTVCPEMAGHALSGTGSAATGLKDAYWQERDWTRFIGDSEWNGSIFFVHGLQDWNVKPDHILPWIDNLPPQIRVKGWLHQDTYNSGHVYPMRHDWNETMIAWLDTELKGKDVGFWDAPVWDVEGSDGLWRAMEAWPPESVDMDVTFSAATVGPMSTATATLDFSDSPYANQSGFVRISGAPSIRVGGTVVNPDPVITAVFILNGEWVGEGVLRAIYDDGLESPSALAPIDNFDFEAYPLDLVIGPGDVLTIEFGGVVEQALVLPTQTAGFIPQGAHLRLPFAAADARDDQPRATPCFAC